MTKKEAVEHLVNQFSGVPQDWVQAMAEKNGDEFYGIMWGTMWLVNNSIDIERIEKMLVPKNDEDDEMYGSQEVKNTGIYAFKVADELVLGINGAGYDFFDAHWIPLYEALGLQWHDKEETITK